MFSKKVSDDDTAQNMANNGLLLKPPEVCHQTDAIAPSPPNLEHLSTRAYYASLTCSQDTLAYTLVKGFAFLCGTRLATQLKTEKQQCG